jgi:hypothetical protein
MSYGVVHADVKSSRGGNSKSFGIVSVSTPENAQRAIGTHFMFVHAPCGYKTVTVCYHSPNERVRAGWELYACESRHRAGQKRRYSFW